MNVDWTTGFKFFPSTRFQVIVESLVPSYSTLKSRLWNGKGINLDWTAEHATTGFSILSIERNGVVYLSSPRQISTLFKELNQDYGTRLRI